MESRRSLAVIFSLAVISGLPSAASAQSVKTLSKPEAEFAEPFTNIGGVRELKDGRVVAIDRRDKIVQLVDFKSGTGTKVGREGSGPGEYALPMQLLALPGDSSAVFDPLNSRLMVVLPNGKPGNFITMEQPAAPGPGGGQMRIGMQPPRYADALGRLYWLGAPFRMSERGAPPQSADSIPVLRYDRSTKKTDTLAYVRVPKNSAQMSGNSGNMRVMIGGANPFAARDEWAVLADGRVAVIRAPEYRVDWAGPQGKTASSPISYEKIKVTEQHKKQWRDSRKNQTAIRITMNNGQRSATATPGGDLPEPTDWPDVMPPFLDNSVFPAPNGTIWIARTRQANDDVPSYDVIDGSGKVVMRVQLPKKTRLIGFGNGTVYTVRTDDDDLQYLQRFRM